MEKGCLYAKTNDIEAQEQCMTEQEQLEISHNNLLEALKEIIEVCPNPKLPYGQIIVEIAKQAIAKAVEE